MFADTKKQMARFFGYYEKKFGEKVWVTLGSFEDDEFTIDLIVGEDTNKIFGAIVSQYVQNRKVLELDDDTEDEGTEDVEKGESESQDGDTEAENAEEDEDEEDYDVDEEEGFVIDYNFIRITPSDEKTPPFEGEPYLTGKCEMPDDTPQMFDFVVYAQLTKDPEPDDPINEVTGFELNLGNEAGSTLYFKEDPKLEKILG